MDCSRRWMAVMMIASAWSSPALAGVIDLDGLADGDSKYIEKSSNAFFRMDLYDPPPRETQQRFRDLDDPSIAYGNPAFDGFPNDERFRLGQVTYDESQLVAGTGTAPVTGLTLGIGYDPDDPTYINYGRWAPLETFVDRFAGTVAVVDGMVTSIDLDSDIRVEFTLVEPFTVVSTGTFLIAGNRFDGYVEGTWSGMEIIWDFAGTLTTVADDPNSSLAGDYDVDRDVDRDDYAAWKTSFGESVPPSAGADGNGDGFILLADYTVWRDGLGATAPGASNTLAIPEPCTGLKLMVTLAVLGCRRGAARLVAASITQ